MSTPIAFDVPHKLGREEARRRIAGGFGKLADFVPGGSITEHSWTGDRLDFVVEAMGQRVAARLDVADANIHASFELPAFLALFSDRIRAKLQREAPKLLE